MIAKSERYRQILAVLARHGIGVVDDELIKHESGDAARAEHLRGACEELGTMFIKLGQVLSTRGDLLPTAYRTPLGSASIAQVHAARMTDGRDVVLTVRKPGVDEMVRMDLVCCALEPEHAPRIRHRCRGKRCARSTVAATS